MRWNCKEWPGITSPGHVWNRKEWLGITWNHKESFFYEQHGPSSPGNTCSTYCHRYRALRNRQGEGIAHPMCNCGGRLMRLPPVCSGRIWMRIILNLHGVQSTSVDQRGLEELWSSMDYRGLEGISRLVWVSMNYRGLVRETMHQRGAVLSWISMDYRGLVWISMDQHYRG